MKLKIEHIAKRLPYGLMVQTADGVFKVVGWSDDIGILLDTTLYGANAIPEYKLILFPLSALTQEITVKGETFIPYKKLWWYLRDGEVGEYVTFGDSHSGLINVVDYIGEYDKLLSYHIDTDSLIDSGLAISVFDLPKNPYR